MPVMTSIHGRRIGLDSNDALLVKQKLTGTKLAGTSDSTATKLANNGFVTVVTTTNDTWVLSDPEPGCLVTLMTGSSSTGTHSINLGNAVAYSTEGIASTTATLIGMGAALTLYAVSTGIWRCVGRHGSTASAYLSS